MARKKFRYYLKRDDATYYCLSGGAVSTSTAAIPVLSDPVEWGSVELRWTRSRKLHGVLRTFVVPLTMTLDGASMLRHIALEQGKEGVCQIIIEEKNARDDNYHLLYKGDIDFSEAVNTDTGFQVAVLDRGLAALLKAKENTSFSIPILDADCLRVLHDGVRVKNRSVFTATSIMQVASVDARQYSPSLEHQTSEAPYLFDIQQSRSMDTNVPAALAATNFSYTASYAGTVRIWFSGNITVNSSTGALIGDKFQVRVFQNSSFQFMHLLFAGATVASSTVGYVQQIPRTYVDINVQPGDTLTLIIGMWPFGRGSAGRYFFDSIDGKLEIEYFLRHDAYEVKGYRQMQVWQKMATAISDNANTAYSDYLTNPNLLNYGNNPWKTLLTCGDAARGLGDGSGAAGTIPAKMKLTLDDLLTDANSRDMLGVGVELDANGNEILRVEPLSHFYDSSTVITRLPRIKNLKWSFQKDFFFNTLTVGYKFDSGNDTLNGKDDPHTTQQWSTSAIRNPGDISLVSPFIASMYSWEYIRSNLSDKKTTSDDGDNDILLLEVDGMNSAGQYLLARRQNLTGNSVSGLIAGETAFNLGLMPKHNLLRNAARLKIGLHRMDNTVLKFQNAAQNEEAAAKLDGNGVIVEKADIAVSALGDPLFLPIEFETDAISPEGLADLLVPNPYGLIEFPWTNPQTGNEEILAGFIDDISSKSGDNASTVWKLLAVPNLDLSKLKY